MDIPPLNDPCLAQKQQMRMFIVIGFTHETINATITPQGRLYLNLAYFRNI
jgi:hypothetical protein